MSEPFPCLVSQDGRWASVAGVELGPAEVEALIWRLAACRAAMVPKRRPVMFEGARIVVGAGLHVQEEADGRLIVAVAHPGVGWVGSRVTVGEIGSVMSKQTQSAATQCLR